MRKHPPDANTGERGCVCVCQGLPYRDLTLGKVPAVDRRGMIYSPPQGFPLQRGRRYPRPPPPQNEVGGGGR